MMHIGCQPLVVRFDNQSYDFPDKPRQKMTLEEREEQDLRRGLQNYNEYLLAEAFPQPLSHPFYMYPRIH